MLAGSIVRRVMLIGLAALAFGGLPAMAEDAPTDAVGVPGPMVFAGENYALSWTSHPTETLYKQEYLPQGQTSEHYTAMFMLDVTSAGATIDQAAQNQIAGLEQRKATDPLVNYRVIHNDSTGETIIDCILSDGTGADMIVEWDAYRYAAAGDGVAVFAISRRAYGDDVTPFMTNLSKTRKTDIAALAELVLPAVTIAQ